MQKRFFPILVAISVMLGMGFLAACTGPAGPVGPPGPPGWEHLMPLPELAKITSPIEVTWLGHAAFKLSIAEGKVVLVDPWITGNPKTPFKDLAAFLTTFKEAKAIIILVTHDHFDHLGDTVAIAKDTTIGIKVKVVATPETTAKLIKAGVKKDQALYGIGMNIGGSVELEKITISMVQALHTSETGVPTGYVIKFPGEATIYHAGDTGIHNDMILLGRLYRLHLALLPIGSLFTMDSYQAARSLLLLQPAKAIPMHFGTFPILEPNADRFLKLAKETAPKVEIIVLEPGKSYSLK